MTKSFFMAMEPPTVTAQEHKVGIRKGKPYFYKPEELRAAEAKLTSYLAKHAPEKKFTGPLELVVTWCFTNKKSDANEWRTSKPDTDNLDKLLKDCMTKVGFWEDDALVCREIIEKILVKGNAYTPPGIYVRITELGDIHEG